MRNSEERSYRDIKNSLDTAKAEGLAEGFGKGRVEGHAEGRAEGLVEGRAEGRAETSCRGRQKPLVNWYTD